MPDSFTTTLYDEPQPTLKTPDPRAIRVDRSGSELNNGDVTYEIREEGESSWDSNAAGYESITAGYENDVILFDGLLDGVVYEVRGRSEAGGETGTFHTPQTRQTLFNVLSGLTIDSFSGSSVTLAWTNSSNTATDTAVLRRATINGDTKPYEEIATLTGQTSGSKTYTDENLRSGVAYEYRLETTNGTASDEIGTVEVTADGEVSVPTFGSGWEVEVDHPVTGRTIVTEAIGEPQLIPSILSLPRIRIPVPKDDVWLSEAFEDPADMRVTVNGEPTPIDELRDVENEEDRTVLVGVGGVELENRAEVEFSTEERYIAARQLVNQNTPYDTDIPEPDSDVLTNQTLQSAATEGGLAGFIPSGVVTSNKPLAFKNGGIETLQSGFTAEGQSDLGQGKTAYNIPRLSGGTGVFHFANTFTESTYTFNPEYEIPEENVRATVQVLYRYLSWSSVAGPAWRSSGFELRVNGTTVETTAPTITFGPPGSIDSESYVPPESVTAPGGTNVTDAATTDGETFLAFGDSPSVGDTFEVTLEGDHIEVEIDEALNGEGYSVVWEYYASEYANFGDTFDETDEWRQIPNVNDSTNGLKDGGTVSWDPEDIWNDLEDPDNAYVEHEDGRVRARITNTTNPTSIEVDTVRLLGGPVTTLTGDGGPSGTGPVGPGSVDVTVESTSQEGNGFTVDTVSLTDSRYGHDLDDRLNNEPGGYHDTPAEQPESIEVPFQTEPASLAIESGTVTAETTPIPPKEVAISSDGGTTYDTAQNSNTITVEYADLKDSLKAKYTIGRSGVRDTQTPRLGFNPQRIESHDLTADLVQQILLINYTNDDSVKNILTDIAEPADRVWSFRLVDGVPTLTFIKSETRVRDSVPQSAQKTVTKSGKTYDRVTVRGSNQQASGEPFVADTNAQSLVRDDILRESETVFDPNTGENFERGTDYTMSYKPGEITAVSGGNLSTGSEYRIDYRYKVEGSAGSGPGPNVEELVRQVSGATSPRQCEQLAFILLDDLSVPRYAADLLIPFDDVAFDEAKAYPPEAFGLGDTATPLEPRGRVERTPDGLRLRLGTRDSADTAVNEIRQQVSTNTDRI